MKIQRPIVSVSDKAYLSDLALCLKEIDIGQVVVYVL